MTTFPHVVNQLRLIGKIRQISGIFVARSLVFFPTTSRGFLLLDFYVCRRQFFGDGGYCLAISASLGGFLAGEAAIRGL
jgi:hypothetical protein